MWPGENHLCYPDNQNHVLIADWQCQLNDFQAHIYNVLFQVAMLDVGTSSVLFITDSLSRSNCSVSSLAMISFTDTNTLINNSKDSTSTSLNDGEKGLAIIMTRDAYLAVLDGRTGHMVSFQSIPQKKESSAISMYILGKSFLL